MEDGEPGVDYLDLAPIAVVVLDKEGNVRRINPWAGGILGIEPREAAGRNWFEAFVPARARAALAAAHAAMVAGRESVAYSESPALTRSGEEKLLAWRQVVLRDGRGRVTGTLAAGEDITARKKAEQELADVKEAIDQAAIVAVTDARGRIRDVNDRFCEISKYRREELVGQDHRILNSHYHPPEFMRDLWGTIEKGRVWRGEIRNRAKDGTLYWVDTTIVPFLDDDGRPHRYLAIHNDITDRKRAEEELRKQESLARVGQMAAVVAHEVRNPLAGIAGAVEIIGSRLPPESSDREVITNILQRIETLNRRVQDLLQFSRPRALRLSTVSIHRLLHETADLLARDPSVESVDVAVSGPETVLPGDGELLKDVFLNLLLNAAQAMGGRGRVRVATSCLDGQCRIEFADRGGGMSEEVRDRVFEPFFTTKNRGTGLGLAIALQIVEGHAGRIEVASEPGAGTTVTVILPLAAELESANS